MTAQAKASRGHGLWPGSPVEGETVQAPKRGCPGPGPGITECPSRAQVGGKGQERAGAGPQDSGESDEDSPAVSPQT